MDLTKRDWTIRALCALAGFAVGVLILLFVPRPDGTPPIIGPEKPPVLVSEIGDIESEWTEEDGYYLDVYVYASRSRETFRLPLSKAFTAGCSQFGDISYYSDGTCAPGQPISDESELLGIVTKVEAVTVPTYTSEGEEDGEETLWYDVHFDGSSKGVQSLSGLYQMTTDYGTICEKGDELRRFPDYGVHVVGGEYQCITPE